MAFEIETPNTDFELRWDNTVRYNVAQLVGARNAAIASTTNFDEGNLVP